MGPEGCPECGSLHVELLLVRVDRLAKRCECGHRWNEQREIAEPLIRKGGYVWRYNAAVDS